MNRIIDFFVVGIKDFFRASFVGIFTIYIIGLFIIFIHELFWLLGYFGFIDSSVSAIDMPFYILMNIIALPYTLPQLTGLENPSGYVAVIFLIIPALTFTIYIFFLIILLIIFAKITMKFLDNFKNKTYSKSFYFIVFLFFNYIYLFIFLGFKKSLYLTLISHYSKIFEFSNENLLFLVLAFCLGLISTYLTKIKFFKGEKYV
ncbi:hypothetical protein [Campylobacter sp.]|uniref:hypothetical protein n=1 Tax=Campylobacter sp. TaxID=205 RepID=UPI002A7F3201|nr:hypothetical protein [Campylobacter sp.]MDY4803513.1 hypothetical protein [Campylobacter sp.]